MHSPFNDVVYARREHADRAVLLRGSTRFERTALGIERRELDLDEVCVALKADIGLSEELIAQWKRIGTSGPVPT